MRKLTLLLALALVAAISGETQWIQGQEQLPQQDPIVAYRLDFAIHELEDGKKINVRRYSMNLSIGPSNVGQSNELIIGTRVPVDAEQGKFQYLDVGTKIWAQLHQYKGSTSMDVRVEISGFATPDQLAKGGQPLLRQMVISGSTLVVLDKPVIIGSVDDPNSKRQFQLEVTAAKIR